MEMELKIEESIEEKTLPLLNEPYIKFKSERNKYANKDNDSLSFCHRLLKKILPFLYKIDQTSKRALFFSDPSLNETHFINKITNTKHNIISFIPMVIINQFIFFGNQFYLIMTLSQFISIFKVGFLFSYLAPLLIVIFMSLIKEAIDEIKKYNRDQKINYEKYNKIVFDKSRSSHKKLLVNSMDIKVGDFIELKEGDRVPADILLLKNLSEEKTVFISTEQLDGETDWKSRKEIEAFKSLHLHEDILQANSFVVYEPPSKEIYEFKGVLHYTDYYHKTESYSLNLENTLWSSTVLKSKQILGIVIYTGKETRIEMNSSKARNKLGILDHELNEYTKLLFAFMFILSLVIVCFKKINIVYRFIIFFRFIVLFCGIIPISLRVNLDLSKTFFQYQINNERKINGTIVRNSSIIEDLGRISYVFSDKTGTLTKNEMVYKEMVTQYNTFTEANDEDIKSIIEEGNHSLMSDLINFNSSNISGSSKESGRQRRGHARNENAIIRDCIRVMALCNNVTPLKQKDNTMTYQAASPDEVALVKYAERLNVKMHSRSETHIKLVNSTNAIEDYDILANFPFSSDTKRMGIILRNKKNEKIMFLIKGAESALVDLVYEEQKSYIIEIASNLSMKGLRTLVLAERLLSKEEYDSWRIQYDTATKSMENRKENIAKAISLIENSMNFLCVTGVEDKLQDNVMDTLENMRSAGIKIWMLTGDKIETAICISISTGLKARNHTVYQLSLDSNKSLLHQMKEFANKPPNTHILVLDGKVIDQCLKDHEDIFFPIALKSPSVICCRCSPTQKKEIVQKVKKYIDPIERTCAVGDGGNDVSMIQQADIGIGIVGKEGLQASLSSDFSIEQFSYLTSLFFWFGRNSYKNTATMSKFIIQRGMIISFIQCFFSTLFYFNAIALYNGMLILGYSTVYTNFPAIAVLLDMDTNEKSVHSFPLLYSDLLKGRELSLKQFCLLVFQSIYQAAVIMIGSIYIFGDNLYLKIVTVTFTELIFAEILNVFNEIKTFNRLILMSLVGTCCTYLFSIVVLKSVLDVYCIFEWNTMRKISVISIAVWMPFYVIRVIKRRWFPEVIEKINRFD